MAMGGYVQLLHTRDGSWSSKIYCMYCMSSITSSQLMYVASRVLNFGTKADHFCTIVSITKKFRVDQDCHISASNFDISQT